MARYFVVFGMKRGGQHGIIHWICSQARPAVHFNNNDFRGPRPRKGRRQAVCQGPLVVGATTTYPVEGGRVPDSSCANPDSRNLVLYNFEDRDVEQTEDRMAEVLKDKKFITLVILRDPYNLLASRVHNRKKWNDQLYRGHMKNYMRPDVVGINYNKWFVSKQYREALCKRLDIPFTDEGINDGVHPYTENSSFDKEAFKKKAQELDVLNRVDRMIPTKRVKLNDISDKVRIFAKEHFNMEFPNG